MNTSMQWKSIKKLSNFVKQTLKIDNHELLPINISANGFVTYRPAKGQKTLNQLKHNDTFPLPEGIEFEEDQRCGYHNLNCMYCGTCAGDCYKPIKVIRLSKKEEPKPDFEKLAKYIVIDWNYHTVDDEASIKEGMEKIWNDYVIPLEKEISELKEQISDLKLQNSRLPELLEIEEKLRKLGF